MSALYRVRQFVRAATAWARPDSVGEELASQYLSPKAMGLFRSMPRYDRNHALNVAATLHVRGYADPDLLVAALLHDLGKTAQQSGRLRLWHRVAVVLVRAIWPGLLDRVGEARPGSWHVPFYVQKHHAAIGARLARQAGCTQRSVGLILHHEDRCAAAEDPLLAALQSADNVN